jgi:hypothetical protein
MCDIYNFNLKTICQRFSNNNEPEFTVQEVMTIYLYVMNREQRLKIKQIHSFANDYLCSWFPLLPSYKAFNMRVNRLSEALFNWLIEKTDIQRASKVRSTRGLTVHIFGRIAAVYIFLIFNSCSLT